MILKAILKVSGAILGPSWGHLGPSWGHLEAILGHLGAILGHLGAILGLTSATFGLLGAKMCFSMFFAEHLQISGKPCHCAALRTSHDSGFGHLLTMACTREQGRNVQAVATLHHSAMVMTFVATDHSEYMLNTNSRMSKQLQQSSGVL